MAPFMLESLDSPAVGEWKLPSKSAVNVTVTETASTTLSPEADNQSETLPQSLKGLLRSAARSDAGYAIHSSQGLRRTTYHDLLLRSQERMEAVRRATDGVSNKLVLLHFDTHEENIEWLWATILAGSIPVMSTTFSRDEYSRTQHLMHLKNILDDPVILTSEALHSQFNSVDGLDMHTVEILERKEYSPAPSPRPAEAFDGAIMMLTSGSSGNAKAVTLTFAQILAAVQGKSSTLGTNSNSVFLNWIGFDHVACLIESHLQAMWLQVEQIHVNADELLADPILFLRLIDTHRVTFSFAPNFFLDMIEKRLAEADKSGAISNINLSSLQTITSGGEANVVATMRALLVRLHDLGAKGDIIASGFGMTETCAGSIYGRINIEYEERERHEYASVGTPIAGAQARVTFNGVPVPSPEVGDLELFGPVVFSHYYNNSTATEAAFTSDDWFKTGDRAYIDSAGKLNLVGRSKDLLVINGVKYAPHDLESAVERANLPGVIPSWTAVFAHRVADRETEGYCVIYGTPTEHDLPQQRIQTAASVSRLLSSLIGFRPEFVVPLRLDQLDKTSLGKLSRAKLRTSFENGTFKDRQIDRIGTIRGGMDSQHQIPESETEVAIVDVLAEILDLPSDTISTDSTLFEVGITSISLFRFEQLLRQRLGLGEDISIITLLSNPVVKCIAGALDNYRDRRYNPVVKLQSRGTKTPLWLCHPASGTVLSFLPLARTLTDRPLYALAARGITNEEELPTTIAEMADEYYGHIKATQPTGPYAIAGYSLGSTVAFELSKRLEANGDEVKFCGAMDSPPDIASLVAHTNWTIAAALLAYFLELIPQSAVEGLSDSLSAKYGCLEENVNKSAVIEACLAAARPRQRERLRIDRKQLQTMVDVTDNFGALARRYDLKGSVRRMDVFYCTPLHSVELDRAKWVSDYLKQWDGYVQEPVAYHDCLGEHADMINPSFIESFKHRLVAALDARGI